MAARIWRRPALGWQGRMFMAALLLLAAGARLEAQVPGVARLWAAQTGPDQVSLSWEPVPGAVEYRIHVGDPAVIGNPAARRPISTLSGSGQSAILTGLRRFAGGLYLVAVGSNGAVIARAPFNQVVPVRSLLPAESPAAVTATATGPEEVTLSWSPVQGATAYMIGRAVAGSGLQMLCSLCSTDATYVDRDVYPGAVHSYTVAAVYPGGVSPRTPSNTVTPGALAATTSPQPSLPAGQPQAPATTWTPPGQPVATMPSYAPPGQPAAAMPSYTPPGQPAAPAGATSPAQAAPTGPFAAGVDAQAASSTIAQIQQQVQSLVAAIAASTGMQLQPTGGLQTSAGAGAQAAFASIKALMARVDSTLASMATMTGNLFQAAAGSKLPQPHAATPVATGPCRLDYQRADNMWAAFGRPDGQLGVESITVADGQTRAFVTDWKYEKQRNDGTNYYGSHLRVAANPGQREVKIQLRSAGTMVQGLLGAIKGSNGNYYLALLPGVTRQFQADLVEVACN